MAPWAYRVAPTIIVDKRRDVRLSDAADGEHGGGSSMSMGRASTSQLPSDNTYNVSIPLRQEIQEGLPLPL